MYKLSSFIIFFIFATVSNAQDCIGYFPSQEGSVMQVTSYDNKDHIQSVNTTTIKSIVKVDDAYKISMHSSMKNEKNSSVSENEFDAHCENGAFFINMKSQLSSDQLNAWKDMDVTVTADDIDYPVDLFSGQKLNDAHLKVNVSMNGMNMPGLEVDVTGRTVMGFETITTPAGTFECVRIKSNQKIKSIISYEVNVVEWLSKGSGVIRTEVLRKNKLHSYSVMTKLTR